MSNKLTPNEMQKYIVIKQYADGLITRKQASTMLGISLEWISKLKGKFLSQGMDAFSHKLRGYTPVNKSTDTIEKEIVDFYLSKYAGMNFEHFIDYINEFKPQDTPECFWRMSGRTVKRIIVRNNFHSPMAKKPNSPSNNHPARYRRLSFGELIQLDASIHDWLGLSNDYKITLHLAIDDATSQIIGAHFEKEETLHGYYEIFRQILIRHGVPGTFYTDKRTVFEYQAGKRETEVLTQYMRACRELGVEIITTSVAQAKGRVERSFKTHQDRLLNELKLNNIKTIDAANDYLQKYTTRHNAKFAIPADCVPNSFRALPTKIDINKTLSIHTERKVLSGNVIGYKSKQYLLVKNGKTVQLNSERA